MTQTTVFDFIPPTYDAKTCPWATDTGNGTVLCTFGGKHIVVDCGGGVAARRNARNQKHGLSTEGLKMTQNRSIDLVNMLFEQMENLRDAAPENIDAELKRARAMSDVAQQINGTYANSIKAAKVRGEYDIATPLLRGGES